jgi:ABC-type Fe3+/spermidine/putrescine transport system ATPase subunit
VLSDRIAIMRQGHIAQFGTPDEVYERPNSPFVANFLGESNFINVRKRELCGQNVRLSCVADDQQELIARQADGQAQVAGCKSICLTL